MFLSVFNKVDANKSITKNGDERYSIFNVLFEKD